MHKARQRVGAHHAHPARKRRAALRVAALPPRKIARGAFDPPRAPWPGGGVGTRDVPTLQRNALAARRRTRDCLPAVANHKLTCVRWVSFDERKWVPSRKRRQWTGRTEAGDERTLIADTRIVDGMELWRSTSGQDWCGTVELSERFHEQLRQHAVPLDRRGIAHLAGNSLGLDLYALLAYRLPKLQRETHLRWSALQAQAGSNERKAFNLAYRVRAVMPDVLTAYPHAKVDFTPHGLLLRPSPPAVPPAVPKSTARGFSLSLPHQAPSNQLRPGT